MNTLTAPWDGAQSVGTDPASWAQMRREQWPDDPYRSGFCLLDQITHPGRLHVIDATPQLLTADEMLTSVLMCKAHRDISMALPNIKEPAVRARYDELYADLEHRRVCGGIGGHIGGCTWSPPAARSTHSSHRCAGADLCWHGWVIKFTTVDRTVAYRIGNYRAEHNAWEATWPD